MKHEHPNPACEGKIKHSSRESAMKQLKYLRKLTKNAPLVVYKCEECGKWHVGGRNRRLVKSALGGASRKHRKGLLEKLKG